MRTKLSILALLTSSVFFFGSCDDDDNYTPEDVVVSAFNSKYPNAGKVEWETKSGYKVADFYIDSKEAEAWFDIDGSWVMTETDLTFGELPTEVQESFNAGTYASWRVDDVDKLERSNTEVVYVVEVEQGNQEFDLYYSADGILIKEINDNESSYHEPTVISGDIMTEIKAMYPNAVFLELEKKGSYYEIDIRDGSTHKEVLFDSNNQWVSTEWDIRTADVPDVVMTALNASEYKNYKIDDVEVLENPSGLFYVFELESGNQEVYLTIKSDGTITK